MLDKVINQYDFSVFCKFTVGRNVEIDGGHAVVLECQSEKDAIASLLDRLGSRAGEIKHLFHGTPTATNLVSISRYGFSVGGYGMFGGGIYFGERSKALRYTHKTGALLECVIALGNCWEANATGKPPRRYDSTHGGCDVGLRNPEWVVYSARRVEIIRAYVFVFAATDKSRKARWYRRRANMGWENHGVRVRGNNDPVVRKILSKPPPPGHKRKSDKRNKIKSDNKNV